MSATIDRKVYQPKTKQEWLILRTTDLTSTEISALFDISPYITKYELWHRKKNAEVVELEENERMKWGSRLEKVIAEGIILDQGWEGKPKKEYISIKDLRLGSSFDYEVWNPGENNRRILEIKNVDSLAFKEGWIVEEGEAEAPPHIELQVQHEMLVSGLPEAHIGALVGGNKVTLINRKVDAAIHEQIKKKAAEFWESIDKNQPPAPDFTRDAKFISSLYGYADPGKVMDVKGDAEIEELVEMWKKGNEVIKNLTADKEALKAKLLTMIGDAEKVLGDGFTISAGMVGEAPIQYVRKAFRNFRISFKKEKSNAKSK